MYKQYPIFSKTIVPQIPTDPKSFICVLKHAGIQLAKNLMENM